LIFIGFIKSKSNMQIKSSYLPMARCYYIKEYKIEV